MSRLGPQVVVASLVIGLAAVGNAETVGAAPPPCRHHDYCTDDEILLPGAPAPRATPADDRDSGQRGGGHTPTTPRCTWVRDPGPMRGGDGGLGAFPDVGPRRSLDDYLIFERCDGELTGRVRWVSPGGTQSPETTPPGPDPEELATIVRVRLEGDLPDPVVATSPGRGEPAIVKHPTFLAVDNWTGTVTDEECALFLCVAVIATPSLTWSSGEPGSPPVSCRGAGTSYDATGPPPAAQAARPGACAHAYQARTGTADRPDRWPGAATVSWDITWSSTSGAAGTLPDITKSVAVPRAVDEVQAIVVR